LKRKNSAHPSKYVDDISTSIGIKIAVSPASASPPASLLSQSFAQEKAALPGTASKAITTVITIDHWKESLRKIINGQDNGFESAIVDDDDDEDYIDRFVANRMVLA
jgi:hypothetical protein